MQFFLRNPSRVYSQRLRAYICIRGVAAIKSREKRLGHQRGRSLTWKFGLDLFRRDIETGKKQTD